MIIQFVWHVNPTDHWHHCVGSFPRRSVTDHRLQFVLLASCWVMSCQRQLCRILATLFNDVINVLKMEPYRIITNVPEKQPSRSTRCDGERSDDALNDVALFSPHLTSFSVGIEAERSKQSKASLDTNRMYRQGRTAINTTCAVSLIWALSKV